MKYPANLQLSDLVTATSFDVFYNLLPGDSLKLEFNGWSPSVYRQYVTNIVFSESNLNTRIASKQIQWGQLLYYILGLIGIILFIRFILPQLGYQPSYKKDDVFKIDNAAEYFKYDLTNIEHKTRELYNRSTLMLVSGILMAIGGVIIFTTSLEDMSHFITKAGNEIDWRSYLIRSLRPSLILIFIEFISIYLLKQYRALINDYKYFYSINLNRLDNAIIFQMLKDKELCEDSMDKVIDVLNTRSDKLNWVNLNDRISGSTGSKDLKESIVNLNDLIKMIRGK